VIPRVKVGKGVTGAVRYVLGEGKDRTTGEYRMLGAGEPGRVAWIGGTGFGFAIRSRDDADLGRRIMEFDAANQDSPTRRCEKDCVHLALGWPPDQTPTREDMEQAAQSALRALGMENAKAVWAAHNDESYSHLHIVASKINPDTGRAYDLKGNFITLSSWAQTYEREHGGVICLRREGANVLRQAIETRDAGAVLAAMTEQRATFTAADLERALGKQIKAEADRARFAETLLGHSEIVALADRADGPTTRYTTRTVLTAEQHVLRAADHLARDDRHRVGDAVRGRVLGDEKFRGMSGEQAAAFRHATGKEALSLIDGQAGTGKSYTMAAIREAYESSGYRVVGLAPTNVVAQGMQRDGFTRAATAHSELFALNNGRASWNARTVVMVDEAAMVDTKMMAMITAHADAARTKLILVGDDRQLSSIERGGMYGVLKDRYGAAELSEVRRQHKNDERRAAEMMAEGNFHDALGIYQARSAITWTRTQDEARAALVEAWAKDSAADPGKSRFVFAYTNDDVAKLNADLREIRRQRGEIGEDHRLRSKDGIAAFAVEDRIQFTATDKKQGLFNGAAGTVQSIEGSQITVKLDGRAGELRRFDSEVFSEFRHGYAGTIYKGQGRTLDQTYLYHSEHWRSAASYVALTRHQDKAELFVATNTAADVRQLARQMARVEERRAASHFHHGQDDDTLKPLGPEALMAELSVRPSSGAPPSADSKAAAAGGDITDRERPIRAGQGDMDNQTIEEAANPDDGATARRNEQVRPTRGQEGEQNQRQASQPTETGPAEELARENAEHQTWQLDEMRTQRARFLAFEADQERRAREARDDDIRRRTDAARGRQAEGQIPGAGDRYGTALADHYDVKYPYSSLARAAMAEYGALIRAREELTRQIAKEQDSELRRALELRKEIEAADYMAITSHRIAGQSIAITGRRDSEEAVRFRERAGDYEAQSRALRQEYRDLMAERGAREVQPTTELPSQAPGKTAGDSKPETPEKDDKAARIAAVREEGGIRREAEGVAQEKGMTGIADAAGPVNNERRAAQDKQSRIAEIREEGRRRHELDGTPPERRLSKDDKPADTKAARIAAVREEGRRRREADGPPSQSRAVKDAKAEDHELHKGEITDDKATRIARVREEGREFRSEQAARQSAPRGRGGGGPSR
jgi:hypothetical protein